MGARDLLQQARLAWGLLRDRRVPLWLKAIPTLALVYVLWPADLAPDIVPILGQVDDLTILVLGVAAFVALCPPQLVQLHRRRGRGSAQRDDERHGPTVEASYRVVDQDSPRRNGA